ncbi:MAG: YqgE/AlgH family protein [Puia sp.]
MAFIGVAILKRRWNSYVPEKFQTSKIRFYIGYSGWAGGQLEDELKEKSWLPAAADRKLIFHKKTEEIWNDAIRHLGEIT